MSKNSSQDAHTISGSVVKVHRGGSWFTESDSTRSSARNKAKKNNCSDGIGLRLVWEPNIIDYSSPKSIPSAGSNSPNV